MKSIFRLLDYSIVRKIQERSDTNYLRAQRYEHRKEIIIQRTNNK